MARPNEAGTEVIPARILSNAQLNEVVSFAEAMAASGLPEEAYSFIGSAYEKVDKSTLVGVPFFIRDFRFRPGRYPGQEDFVIVRAITQNDVPVVFTDGGTGVRAQLEALEIKRTADNHPTPAQNVLVANGLVVSNYDYTDPDTGETVPAATYYLG